MKRLEDRVLLAVDQLKRLQDERNRLRNEVRKRTDADAEPRWRADKAQLVAGLRETIEGLRAE